jgi:recombination protein RecA
MAKKRTEGLLSSGSEDLAKIIARDLNNSGLQTYFLGEGAAPVDIDEFVSTGDTRLDIAISNRPHGGIACGRITELLGWEGAGKSLMAAHMMANVQKEGGVAILLDTENAVNQDFFNAIGLDFNKVVYAQPETVEEIFEIIEKIIESYRQGSETNREKKVIIVVDSVAAAPTKREIEANYDKDGYATDKALILSKAMRKITNMIGRNKITLVFCNQLRVKMDSMSFGEKWTTSGGRAIGFHASTRLKLNKLGKISAGDEIVGVKVQVVVEKNRLGPPHRKIDIDIYFDRGIDSDTSAMKFLKDTNVIKGSGAWYTYVDSNGEEHKFQSKSFKKFCADNPEAAEEIYQKMCNAMIMLYNSNGITTEDEHVSIETE